MHNWKRSVKILWLCNFMINAGMTMIMPFLPLFLETLGVHRHHELSLWTGVIFSATFLSGAIMAPIWGIFADKYGQRVNLIRAGIGMGIITFLMAFSISPAMLLILRFIVGFFSGFITVSFSYLSRITPRNETGTALGLLQTGGVSGGIIGPLLGGALSDLFGFRPVFAVTGILILLTTLLVIFFLEKDPVVQTTKAKEGSFAEILKNPILIVLLIATFIVQAAILGTNSMMTIFVKTLVPYSHNLAFISGFAASIAGIANMIGSPYLGRLSDKLGQAKTLPVAMVLCGLFTLPQIWTHHIWELYIWRFAQGLLLGGMWPAIQALIHLKTAKHIQGRAFGVTSSSRFLGNLAGPLVAGWISGYLSISYVFAFSGILLILGSLLVKWKIKPDRNKAVS
ncbi:MFS transporter [Scopulibacillus cellulosilyticus]|uniref:MFS transporter n=2 Tax=Scopulibacillus cellulosilyticus TaxID=2665665 RepID=A0ABW2PQX6_9BACL